LAAKSGSDTPGERTEQERERAREERERRRLAKAAATQAPVVPPLPAPLPEPPPEPELPPEPPSVSESGGHSSSQAPSAPPTDGPPPLPALGGPLCARARPSGRRRPRSLALRLGVLILIPVAVVLLTSAVLTRLVLPSGHPAPPPPPKVVKLVIPEGFTRAQIAQRAHADGVSGNYLAASTHSLELNPQHYGAPARTPNLEGFLFPATYEIYAGEPASRLVGRQLTAFEENFGPAQVRRAKALGIISYQLLIVASMVEREAQIPNDRAKIAAVIYNRLHAGMPLGIDATIYYAVEQQKHIATYTGELTESQLHIRSPYNTRLHTGLPPTPISNPGLASIEAAVHPAHVSYLYYVAGADGCGEQVFSDTATQFESDVAAYKAAVVRNDGKPPACKRKP
jgi:cell division protein YceG involved in septum cleavage